MSEDYESAAIRHFEDATTLKAVGRFDNSGHLLGFAAECAIKHGMASIRPSGKLPQSHIPSLIAAARTHIGPRSCSSMFYVLKGDIFKGWHVSHRYAKTGNTDTDELGAWFVTTKRLFAAANLKVRK